APRPNDRARFTAARAARARRAHGARGRRLQSAILARAAGGVALPPQPPLVAAAVLDHRDRGRRGDGGGHRAGAGARGNERAAVGPAGEDPHREPAPAGAHLRGGAAARRLGARARSGAAHLGRRRSVALRPHAGSRLRGHDYAEGVFVLGVDPDTGTRAVTSLARHFTKGDLRFRTTRAGVEGGLALGTRLASKLSAYPGYVVTLVAAAGSRFNPSLGAFIPRYHRFEVTGLFDTGMYEYDNSYVAMDRRVAQRFADLDKAVTGLEVRLADPWQARAFGLRLETELGYPYRALNWQSQNASLFSALKLEKLAMAVVVFLICVVAAFNVVGTLTMLVRDKTREIGILLAMGLRRTSIRRIF